MMKRSSPKQRTAAVSTALLLLYSSGALCFTTVQHSSAPRRFGTQLSIPKGCDKTRLFVGTNLDDNNGNGRNEDEKPSSGEMQTMISDVGPKIVAVALFGFILINTLSFATTVTTAAFSALFAEIGREAVNLFFILGNIFLGILSGIFGLVKVAVPALGKSAVAAGKAAAPIIGSTAKTIGDAAAPVIESTAKSIGDAAAPIVQDMTEQISQTAGPYVQPVMETVDSSVKGAVDSFSSSVDEILMSPLRDVATSVTGNVNTAVDSGVRETARAIDASIVAPINAARDSITNAVDSTIKGATDSAIGAMDGAMKGAVDAVSSSFFSSDLGGADTTLE
ncbi:hypothetical protein ACHAWT_004865 [Skeletonema menzelii]